MLPSRLLACASLAAASLSAQQFQLELPRDVLGQTSLSNLFLPAAADLNGDGKTDLLFSDNNHTPEIPRLFLNQGSHFVAELLGAPPVNWGAATLFDIDNDGDIDIYESGGPRLLRNEGTGNFVDVTATHFPIPAPTFGQAEATDIDGDGDLDLLLPFGRIIRNDGQGVFDDVTATNMITSGFAIEERLAVADFDGDGDQDFVIMSGLHRNDGHGVFTIDPNANASHLYGEMPTACDVDMDGDIDVLLSSGRDLRNDGTGNFIEAPNFLPPAPPNQTPPWTIEGFADVNGDGAIDVLLSPYSPSPNTPHPAWAANDGQGTFLFAQAQELPTQHTIWHNLSAADVDDDGDNDLISINRNASVSSPAAVLYNDGSGTFYNATHLGSLNAVRTYGRFVTDFDNDGDDDIVAGAVLQRNDGTGNLTNEPFPYGMYAVAFADFNDDGVLDALGGDSVWIGQGGMNFVQGPDLLPSSESIRDEVVTDLDGDGDLDLVVLSGSYGQQVATLRIFHNDGSGTFSETGGAAWGLDIPAPRTVASADFNSDGHPDLLFASYDPWGGFQQALYMFTGSASGQFSEQPVPIHWWHAREFHITDLEGDGDLDFVLESAGYPILYTNDGSGVFVSEQLDDLAGTVLRTDDVDLDGDQDLWSSGSGWPILFVNDGTNHFEAAPSRVASEQPAYYHSLAEFVTVDLDRDGDRDVIAAAVTSGGGDQFYVPLWNHVRQLRAPHLTTIGGTLDLFLSAIEAPTTPLAAVGVSGAKAQVQTPFGTLGIDLTSAILTTATLGPGTTQHSLTIPNDPALQGLELHAQAMLLAGTDLVLTGTVSSLIVP